MRRGVSGKAFVRAHKGANAVQVRRRVSTASASAAGPQGRDVGAQWTEIGSVEAGEGWRRRQAGLAKGAKQRGSQERLRSPGREGGRVVKLGRRRGRVAGDGTYGGRLGGNFPSLLAVGMGPEQARSSGCASRAVLEMGPLVVVVGCSADAKDAVSQVLMSP